MKVLKTVAELIHWRDGLTTGETVGFVPTMGDLHAGHFSLVEKARNTNTRVVVSIFVNPKQFNNQQDFEKYHRNLQADLDLLQSLNVDAVFAPSADDFYPNDFQTYVTVERIEKNLCGAFRPGHFRGVATVVLKLFNLVQANRAYFGLKDFQQCRLIAQMVHDLSVPIEVIFCPTVREVDGLAMSSRNRRLNTEERRRASKIFAALNAAGNYLLTLNGDALTAETIRETRKIFEQNLSLETTDHLEYFEILDAWKFEPANHAQNLLIACAVHVGPTRLIDNLLLK